MLLDPRRYYLPFYVGKGIGNRAWAHLTEKENSYNRRKIRTIQKIRKFGKEPSVMIWKAGLTCDEAFTMEKFLINRFGRRGIDNGGILTNITASGLGGNTSYAFTDESRKKISKSSSGRNNARSKLTEQEVFEIFFQKRQL